MSTLSHYEIIDRFTGAVVATVKTLKAASKAVDTRDMKYGACRFGKRAVYVPEVQHVA